MADMPCLVHLHLDQVTPPDQPCVKERDIWKSTKAKTDDLDQIHSTNQTFLAIIYLSSLAKELKCIEIKSWILALFTTIHLKNTHFVCDFYMKCLRIKSHILTLFTTMIKVYTKENILALMPYMVQIMAGLYLHAISLPFAVPIFVIFWFISRVVKILVWLQYGSTASKCSGLDSLWGLDSPSSRPINIGMLTMSGIPNIEKIKNHIQSKILDATNPSGNYQYRKFRQLFYRRFGYYIWQDDVEFDISNHVSLVRLKHNVIDKKCQILKYVSGLESRTLPRNRPPWHITVLHTGAGKYNLIILMHHAIGDGFCLVRVCMENLVDTPIPRMYPSPIKSHRILQVLTHLWSAMVLPLGMLRVIANNDNSSLHGKQLTGEKVVVSANGVPLDLIRRIKRTAGVTVNDVLMSCLSSATTKLMARRKEMCTEITTIIPVSLHSENESVKLSNCFSCDIVKLPATLTTSSLARLQNTKNVFEDLNADPTMAAVHWSIAAVSDIIPAQIAEKLFTGRGITAAATNIPGPHHKLIIGGDTVEEMAFWAPNRAPTGVGLSIISYNGVIRTSLNVDTALIASEQEAQQFLDDFEWEVYQLNDELRKTKERYSHWSKFRTLHTAAKTFLKVSIDEE